MLVSFRYDFEVRWEPFLLRPHVPPGGQPRSLPDPNNPVYDFIEVVLNAVTKY